MSGSSVLKNALAECAWKDAVDPHHSMQMRSLVGSNTDMATFEKVLDKFGKEAADAWADAVDARRRYFDAVK